MAVALASLVLSAHVQPGFSCSRIAALDVSSVKRAFFSYLTCAAAVMGDGQ